MQFAIIDIEATGGSPKRDKITEIAIFLYDEEGNSVVDSFSTLINPEIDIPPFISKLTGITNAMVADAPTFGEVAGKINDITKDAVFVAHNVQFDYAYVRAEFKRLGTQFQRPKLCTINLAKNVFPEMASYGLGNMCKDLGITISNRHRAKGDAEATVRLFEMMLEREQPTNHLAEYISDHLAYENLPSQLPSSLLDQLPEETGVYYLHDKNGKIIYLSRSNDIRRRIFQHFKGKNARYWNILSQTYDITYDETGSELIAQLLEIYHIRRLRPRFNRRSSLPRFPFGIFAKQGRNGFLDLEARRKHGHERPEIVFEKQEEVGVGLLSIIKDHQLCPALCGLKVNQRKKCMMCGQAKKGTEYCEANIEYKQYNRRVRKAMRQHQYPIDSFLVIGEGRHINEQSIVCVENGRYLGFVYIEKNMEYNLEMIKDGLKYSMEGMEAQKILISYLKKNKLDKVIEF